MGEKNCEVPNILFQKGAGQKCDKAIVHVYVQIMEIHLNQSKKKFPFNFGWSRRSINALHEKCENLKF